VENKRVFSFIKESEDVLPIAEEILALFEYSRFDFLNVKSICRKLLYSIFVIYVNTG